jgi:ankyrin repeat protein
LFIAVNAGHGKEVIEALLAIGADPNVPYGDQEAPLHVAARWGRVEVAELLLRAGANPNQRGKYDKRPLGEALKSDPKIGMIELLCRFGASVADQDRWFSLRKLIGTGRVDVLEVLCQAGADPNDSKGAALFRAASEDEVEDLELLIRFGGDLEKAKLNGKTVLEVLKEKHREDVEDELEVASARCEIKLPAHGATSSMPSSSAPPTCAKCGRAMDVMKVIHYTCDRCKRKRSGCFPRFRCGICEYDVCHRCAPIDDSIWN